MATETGMKTFGPLAINTKILTLALARMVDSFGNSFLIVVLPLYIASGSVTGGTYGLSVELITGIILSMFGFFNSSLQPFTGRSSDRLGRRKLFVLIGLAILAITNFVYSLTHSYATLLLIRVFQGIGVAFTVPATVALVNELSTIENRGGNMGTFNTFRIAGFAGGPLVAGTVVESGPYTIAGFTFSGFAAAFYIAALGALISFALVTRFVSDPEGTPTAAGDELGIRILAREDESRLLDPVFTLGIASLMMAVGIALFSTIQPDVNARLNQGPSLFGIEFAAFALGQVLTQSPIGTISDRYGRKPFILWGLILLVPVTLVQGLVVTPAQMIVARFIQGIAAAMVFAPALAGDLAAGGQSGSQLSILTMAFGFGTAFGPLSSGALIQFGFVVPFAFGAVLAAISAVLVYTQIEETIGRGEPPVSQRDLGRDSSHHRCRAIMIREG